MKKYKPNKEKYISEEDVSKYIKKNGKGCDCGSALGEILGNTFTCNKCNRLSIFYTFNQRLMGLITFGDLYRGELIARQLPLTEDKYPKIAYFREGMV